MHVLAVDGRPFHRLRFLNAAKRGGTETAYLPFLRGRVDSLPDDLDALLLTSDLQGIVQAWPGTALLGIAASGAYQELAAQGSVPMAERTGVLLSGDLYASPTGDVRGATGDVYDVWASFASSFAWVAGVQGNHDFLRHDLSGLETAHLLDVTDVTLTGLRIAGVGGVIGDPSKPTRRSEADYLAGVELALAHAPEILLLHQAPTGGAHQRGHDTLSTVLQQAPGVLTVCGHVHWDHPVAQLPEGHMILNVDKRVVVLTR